MTSVPSPEGDAIRNKLQEIACRLQHAALDAMLSNSNNNNNNNSNSSSAAESTKQPLKVTVAKPFEEDYQGYFVLTLNYQSSAVHLDPNFVLSCAGVKGSTLKSQVWSGNTFQLLIPKYESEETNDGTTSKGGGGGWGGIGWLCGSSSYSNKTGRAARGRRSKEELVLILLRLIFGLCILQGLSLFIRHGDAEHYQGSAFSSSSSHGGGGGINTSGESGEMYHRISELLTNSAANLRAVVHKVVLNTWVISL